MKIGDRVKYNRTSEAVILKIEGNYALIQFDSGTKICTNIHGLKKNDPKADLTVSASGTVGSKIKKITEFNIEDETLYKL